MSDSGKAGNLQLIPLDRIDVLNTRERNDAVFDSIVNSIAAIGLKKPVTVTPRGAGADMRFVLICGEGRLRAFRKLQQSHIPAMVVEVNDEDAFIMSLAENIARRKYRALELLDGLKVLHEKGYGSKQIADKTGLAVSYVNDLIVLLRKGEDRVLSAVRSGTLPISAAMAIVGAGDDDAAVQGVLHDAYQSGELRGRQLMDARRLIEKRVTFGKTFSHGAPRADGAVPRISTTSLVRAYQKEVLRQQALVTKAAAVQQRLMFVAGALRKLASDENCCNLLRAEGLETLPKYLADRVVAAG
jgi:ParB family chromosome partitioning protein